MIPLKRTPVRKAAVKIFARPLDFDDLAAVALLDVLIEDDLELLDDVVALERGEELAVDIHRRLRLLEGSGERDADVGVLATRRGR